jgi:small GTP-binding protein
MGLTCWQRERRILMVGLDGSGKTTILFQMKHGELIKTVPTIGFNLKTVELNRRSFVVWDIGGHKSNWPLFRHYYSASDAVIFVVDSSDRDRTSRVVNEFDLIIQELADVPILILANKQDIADAMSVNEVAHNFQVEQLTESRTCKVQGTCGTSGEGILEGFEWLVENLH